MVWFVLAHLIAFLVDLVFCARQRDRDKDFQIMVLRHQVRLLQRQRPRLPRLGRSEKLTLAVLAAALARLTVARRHSPVPGAGRGVHTKHEMIARQSGKSTIVSL